ncbi:hypothetical protein [Oenococcus sp.]|uniref:hypothetical protein n=1 Tax=Oenococcus sp. TaxID=1979414 RepID=UPI0039E95140
MGTIFKWVIFISSYLPVCLMIFLKHLKIFRWDSVVNVYQMNPLFWKLLIFIQVISIVTLIIWLSHLKRESKNNSTKYKVNKVRSYDAEVLNFFVTFIIPILSLNLKSWPSIVMNILLIFIEGIYFVQNNALYFNVLLIISGYHIFSFDGNNMIITRKKQAELTFDDSKATQIGTTNIFYI